MASRAKTRKRELNSHDHTAEHSRVVESLAAATYTTSRWQAAQNTTGPRSNSCGSESKIANRPHEISQLILVPAIRYLTLYGTRYGGL